MAIKKKFMSRTMAYMAGQKNQFSSPTSPQNILDITIFGKKKNNKSLISRVLGVEYLKKDGTITQQKALIHPGPKIFTEVPNVCKEFTNTSALHNAEICLLYSRQEKSKFRTQLYTFSEFVNHVLAFIMAQTTKVNHYIHSA